MNKQIDLHGCTEAEAIMKISNAVYSFLSSDEHEIVFITGRGDVLGRVLEDYLDSEQLLWRHEGRNTGSYTVFKRRRGAA